MEYVHMLLTTNEGQAVVGQFSLQNGKLNFTAVKAYRPMMKEILEERGSQDPSKWLKSLPTIYSGSALRAEYGATNGSETADRSKEAARKISRFKV